MELRADMTTPLLDARRPGLEVVTVVINAPPHPSSFLMFHLPFTGLTATAGCVFDSL
jgi:hypothetical protein